MYNVFNEMYTKHEFSDSLFDEFWSNSDISYTDYQNLMIIADFQFACFGEPGWSTDMGKTFLTWGSPDEINKYENDFESLVVWIYWQYNKKFYFTRKNDATCYILDPFGEFKNLEQ
jgi:GWxTD domain-containing protein